MKIEFSKYHGTGNDFILIDGRSVSFPHSYFTEERIGQLCHRRFGIGADGLIILKNDDESDFYMDYYNSDGRPSSMCGNGSRCILDFARALDIISTTSSFRASDGWHSAKLDKDQISVLMNVAEVKSLDSKSYFIDTGSPHHVCMVDKVSEINVDRQGRAIRQSEGYQKEGVNVNFLESKTEDFIEVATYERGVEAETLSCGTGVTAAALVWLFQNEKKFGVVDVKTKGGQLSVEVKDNKGKKEVWLKGPAAKVFTGHFEI